VFKYVAPLNEFSADMFQECGGKAANLGELICGGFNVPPGFCIKANTYPYLIESNNLNGQISQIADTMDFIKPADLEEKSGVIRSLIINARIPQDLGEEISQNYQALKDAIGEEPLVAVRSSVAVKDSTISSFPGMMDTYHYIRGYDQITQKIKECLASVWTARAAFMRHHKKIDHSLALIAPIVQLMVNSEIAGVMFTGNPMTSSLDEILIDACWGLGELVVSGQGADDLYVLDKANLSIKSSTIANKSQMIVFDTEMGRGTKKVPVPPEKVSKPALTEHMLKELGMVGLNIEAHYNGVPQDIEWAFCGGQLYVLQTRRARVAQP
jgi:phosphoenolpyruvate synthase/pyruvate phosphate dikinase